LFSKQKFIVNEKAQLLPERPDFEHVKAGGQRMQGTAEQFMSGIDVNKKRKRFSKRVPDTIIKKIL